MPDDATADVDVVAGMGSVKCSVPSVPVAGVPHFRVHGRAGMGSVTVRRRYRFAGAHPLRTNGPLVRTYGTNGPFVRAAGAGRAHR